MNIYIIIIIIVICVVIIKKRNEKFSLQLIKTNTNEHFSGDEFDVYIIHMIKNKDRLQNFNNYYNNSDLSFKKINIFPAVVGKDLNLINFVSPKGYTQILLSEKTNTRARHYELTRGAVGCYLSHLSIYKKIVESNVNYGIIFEDDSIIASDFYKRMLYGFSVIPSDWDIILLGVICLKCDILKDYIKINRFWGTHGYIIKKDSAVKVLSYLDKPLSKQIDADLSLLIKRNLINVYAVNPIIVAQDVKFGSDIQMPVNDSPDSYNEEFSQHSIKYISSNIVKIK